MRIVGLLLLTAVLLGVGWVIYWWTIPESEKIEGSISKRARSIQIDREKFMGNPLYQLGIQGQLGDLDSMSFGLAMAYNREGKPGAAIDELEGIIGRSEAEYEGSGRTPSSPVLRLRAIYFDELVKAFDMLGDKDSREKAAAKRSRLNIEASKTEVEEAKKESQRKAAARKKLLE